MNVGVEFMSVVVPLGEYRINCMKHDVHHCETHIDLSSILSNTFWEWFSDCASYIYLKYNNGINQCYFEGLGKSDNRVICLYEKEAFRYNLSHPTPTECGDLQEKILEALNHQNVLLETILGKLNLIGMGNPMYQTFQTHMTTINKEDQNGEDRTGRTEIEKQPDTTEHTCISEGASAESESK